ncbi:hypothetical protein GGQ84_001958 [Desulfitispora alkaliphila]|uniref:stalk domain-containing protein n=1 Tax=Desulfitispora alkaliphila TaxID=622674 RepID=UPI003D245420
MKTKKILIGVLSASIITLSAGTSFSSQFNDNSVAVPINSYKDTVIVGSEHKEEITGFGAFTGKVKEISDFQSMEGTKIALLESEDGKIANILVSESTYILDDADIKEGSVITGYYDLSAPMLMIYPPQYRAEAVVIETEEKNVKMDVFDKNLISADNTLKLNVTDETKIVWQDGTEFTGDLKNRKLVVEYDISTRSIPAQTNPKKVTVLNEGEENRATAIMDNVSNMEIVVNNERIDAPSAYTNEADVVMVPLRPIAEAIGYEISWDSETQSIRLGLGINLTIGEDNYIYMKTAPIKLGTAPTIENGITYVPLNFFREVMKMNNAYVFEGQIVIDDGEVME